MGIFERLFVTGAVVALLLVQTGVAASDAASDVAEILVEYGLPQGLLPGTVRGYTLTSEGKFEVTLGSACTTKISTEEVNYKKSISGKLSYGKITDLSGIQAHEFFWVSITSIEVDKNNPDVIWFEVGFLAKSLSVELFKEPPTCNSLVDGEDRGAITFSEWLSKGLSGALEVMPRTGAVARRVLV